MLALKTRNPKTKILESFVGGPPVFRAQKNLLLVSTNCALGSVRPFKRMNESTNCSCENGRGARGPKCLDLHEFLSYMGFLF